MHIHIRLIQSLFLLGCLTNASNVFAHKVNIFVFVEGDQASVEGYFADGKKAKNSEITVTDSAGKTLIEGKTNDEGQFTFPLTVKSDLKIVLNAGLGHQADYSLTAAEMSGETLSNESTDNLDDKSSAPSTSGSATSLPPNQLKRVIHQAVAEAIKPLAKEIYELKNHTSITQIIGGIGYIFGILGIVAYLKSRKK